MRGRDSILLRLIVARRELLQDVDERAGMVGHAPEHDGGLERRAADPVSGSAGLQVGRPVSSHTNLVSFSGVSSTRSASTSQPYSSAEMWLPSAAQGWSDSATIRTASAVLCAPTTSAPAQPLAQEPRALGAGLGMGEDALDPLQGKLRPGDQRVRDRVHDLADDLHLIGLEHERVERRVDRALEGVLDRYQRAVAAAVGDRHHAFVDRRQRYRLDALATG